MSECPEVAASFMGTHLLFRNGFSRHFRIILISLSVVLSPHPAIHRRNSISSGSSSSTGSCSSICCILASCVIVFTPLSKRSRLQHIYDHCLDHHQARHPKRQQRPAELPAYWPLVQAAPVDCLTIPTVYRLPAACADQADLLRLSHVSHWLVPPFSRLRGFLDRIFNCYSLLLFQKADQYFHDLFDIHMHHLSTMYAVQIVSVSPLKSCLSDTLCATLLKEVLDRYSKVVGEDFKFFHLWFTSSWLPIGKCRFRDSGIFWHTIICQFSWISDFYILFVH